MSRSTAGVFYDVVIGLDGVLQCNCPASFNHLDCWHIRFVREEMNMTTETSRALVPIVVQPPAALLHTQADLDVINNTAAMVFAGGVSLPRELNSPQKVAAVMLYGLELGLRPMTAIQHLYIVDGKVAASAQVLAGLCMNKEKDVEFHVEQLNESVCTIRMIRPSRHVNETRTITWEQIKRAGLARGNNLQYPEDRLTYHTVKRLCRLYAPDLINGLADGVAVPGVSDAPQWRVEESDLYNEGDAPANVDRETGEIFEHEAPQEPPVSASAGTSGSDVTTAPAPSPTVPAADITQALNAISERHGQQSKVAAINVMTRFYDTAVPAKLDTDQRVEYLAMLKVRLDAIEHEHEGAFTAYGHPVCRICGDDVKPPVGQEIQQPALSP